MPDRRKYAGKNHPPPGAQWQQLIDAYLPVLAAAGQPASTINLRRGQLTKMARELAAPPSKATAERLLAWFGGQDWATETRRSYRGTPPRVSALGIPHKTDAGAFG